MNNNLKSPQLSDSSSLKKKNLEESASLLFNTEFHESFAKIEKLSQIHSDRKSTEQQT